MWIRTLAVLLCLFAGTSPVIALSLDEMQTRFDAAVSAAEGEIDAQLKTLKKKYLEALFRFEAEVKREGDLDSLSIARLEIERVSGSETYSPAMKTGQPRLDYLSSVMKEELDKIYSEQAQKLSSLIESVSTYSEQRVLELTQEGDVQQALAMREWTSGLREIPQVADLLSKGNQTNSLQNANANVPRLLRESPKKVIHEKRDKFGKRPAVYAFGSQPVGKEKRIREERTTAAASGMTTFQAKPVLIEEKTSLSRYRSYSYRRDHDELVYVARLELGLLPNQSIGPSLVVFDLYKRGSGSRRSIIRTEGLLMPEMAAGERRVIDSGVYTYEVREYDSSYGYDSKYTTGDEFYGYIVSIFDEAGTLIYQRCTERALVDLARTSVPNKFDRPQE